MRVTEVEGERSEQMLLLRTYPVLAPEPIPTLSSRDIPLGAWITGALTHKMLWSWSGRNHNRLYVGRPLTQAPRKMGGCLAHHLHVSAGQ